MDEIDFYTNVIIEAAHYDPVLRRALERLPPPPVHHHCSCCGRIIPQEDLSRETTAAVSTLSFSSSESTVIPSRNKPPTERRPTSKAKALRGRTVKHAESSKLVDPVAAVDRVKSVESQKRVDAIKPNEATKLAEPVQLAKREESPELSKPTEPEAMAPQRDQRLSEEVPIKHTRPVPQPAYVEQKYWRSSDETPTKPRVKAKARHRDENITPSSPPPQEVTARANPSPTTPEVIAVSSASKETLSRLFTSDPKQKRQVHFDDIVAALEDAGLTAKRGGKCAGSAVTFKDRGGKGSISFHCPHPDPRIEFHKLRTWGTRLQNKFGWELETFVDRVG